MTKVLLVEDDPAIRLAIAESLVNENYTVDEVSSATEAFKKVTNENYDLILLDLILPDMDGMELCKKLRDEDIRVPIIMVTSRKDEIDKIIGLEIGADDYITKPFIMRELLARMKALLRRVSFDSGKLSKYSFGNISVDFKKFEALKDGKPIKLSATEFRVLHYFIQHEGEVISRDKFLDDVWGYDSFPTTRTVDNFILSLRKKIEDNPAEPKHLITVYKIGYKFIK
uniref:Response regulator transcription factor n=1 Tax=Ignavibacterium album TaxID=591197 RepID=A0A832DJK2_9BACT